MDKALSARNLSLMAILTALLFAVMAARVVTAQQTAESDLARQILRDTNVKGGVIVHLGCGDGKLTAALRTAECYIVHGLDIDAKNIRQARSYIQGLGTYGPVSVDRFDGRRLPYADNLVNLLVADSLGDMPPEEAMRVLAPGGTLCVRDNGSWRKKVKPARGNTDEWTHYLHDSSGNAVSHDALVGPPRYVQWIAEPRHTRSHEHIPSINALVSTGGRIFYVADEGPIGYLRCPARWSLVARDAYNGVMLWKRPFDPWFPHIVCWGSTPQQLQRRLVAAGDRVYVTLGLHAPVSAVDPNTGKTLKVYEQTRGAEEIVLHNGILLIVVRRVTEERVAELEKWKKLSVKDGSPIYDRDTALPLLRQFHAAHNKAALSILALEAKTGRALWKKDGDETARLRGVSVCANGDRVFYQNREAVVCADLETGKEQWKVPSCPPLRVVNGKMVICANGKTVTALSAEAGKALWSQPASLCDIRDAFIINGTLWLGGFKPWQGRSKGKRGPAWGPYYVTQRDLATGKILKRVEPECPGHHHRCWRNKATDRYILSGRRGVEFVDLQSGDVLWHSWVRGVCKYGVMPCNGLLYAPPHACACYIAAKLEGFYALAHEIDAGLAASGSNHRKLERGPAYSEEASGNSPGASSDWPTYRHDAERSGFTPSNVPAELQQIWQVDVGGNLTAATVAGTRVVLASSDRHTVSALNADSGASAWSFTAGARIDSPPTLHAGRAVFGCNDGCVYSLRTSDGALSWRLRTERADRLIAARGQLESASPVPGSVLINDGAAYFAAGRSSYLDGGIDVYRVRPEDGKVMSKTPIYSPDPQTGRQPKQYGPAYMPGALGEILTADDVNVYLRDMVFDKSGAAKTEGNPHLFTLTGFLDESWPHRSYWIFGTRCSIACGCSGRAKNLVSARLLVFNDQTIYGYGRSRVHWSNQLQDGPYRLFALDRAESTLAWTQETKIRARAMILAGKVLFVAGQPPLDESELKGTTRDAVLVAISAVDGKELARYALDAPVVYDGIAAANGRLYIALQNGHVVCMGGKATKAQ